jgi:hypothetical protein
MDRRTTRSPVSDDAVTTGTNTTLTGMGLAHTVVAQPGHVRGYASGAEKAVPQNEQNESFTRVTLSPGSSAHLRVMNRT